MRRLSLRALLLVTLPGVSSAATLHHNTSKPLQTHTHTTISPAVTAPARRAMPHDIQSQTQEAVTVRVARHAPRLARKVPLGAFGTRSEFDTPFSVSTISADRIEQMQATDINDVMRYEPGVQANSNRSSTASGSSVRVRRLNLDWTNGYKIDGLAIPYWYIDLPLANFDHVQVIKGASAFMYGFGSPGGVLDYQLKAPLEERKLTWEAGYRSDAVFRQMLDVGGIAGSKPSCTDALCFCQRSWKSGE